jgi:hypothetical protein
VPLSSPATEVAATNRSPGGVGAVFGPEYPKEVELLLTCARLTLDEPSKERLREMLQEELDWNRFLRLMILHCLTAFVYRHLEMTPKDLVPASYLQFIKNNFMHDAAAALHDISQLLNLLDLFEQEDVLVVPYKGPALAVALYGNAAFRRCNDLDVVVTRDDVPVARNVLEKAGFKSLHPTSPAGREFLLERRHSEIFTRESGPIVELHWAFAKQRGLFPLTLDMLVGRLEEISIAGARVKMFAPEDHLLILCTHGANHLWSRLEWLCGVSELIKTGNLSWPLVLHRAAELRSIKALLLGALLSGELLDAPVPEEVLARARANRDVVWSANLVKRKLATGQIERPEERSAIERDLFRLRLQSSNGTRIRYLMHRFTTPKREDTRNMLRIGGRFIPLPAFLRPFHVLGRLLGNVVPRLSEDEVVRKGRE